VLADVGEPGFGGNNLFRVFIKTTYDITLDSHYPTVNSCEHIFPYAFIPFLMVPTARERKINTCAWLLHPNIKNQGKGMLEVP